MASVDRTNNNVNSVLNVYRQRLRNAQTNQKAPSNVATDGDATGNTGPVDQFVPSEGSSEINRLKEKLNQLPDVDEQKVAQLREQIKNGSYKIDSREVAEKMLATGANLSVRR